MIEFYDTFAESIRTAVRRPFMYPENDPRNWPIHPADIYDKKNYLYFMEEFIGKWDMSKLGEIK